MRDFTWLFLLLIVGCAAKPQDQAAGPHALPDRQQTLKNLKAQAEEVGRSVGNPRRPCEDGGTHAPCFGREAWGSRRTFKKLESIAAEMKEQGFRLKKFTIGDPSELVQAAGQIYAVVPDKVEMSDPSGAAGRKTSFLIAVSPDGGVHWNFIDGAGGGGDRSKLKRLLPDFPEQLQLPAAQLITWDEK